MTDTLTLTRTTRLIQPTRILIGCLALVLFSATAVADDDSDEVAALILAAELALEKQEYQVASSKYRQAADLSDDAEVAMQATRIGYSYGFNEDAIRAANRWAKLAPDNDEAALYVAQLYLRSGEIRQSRKSFERLLKKGEQPVDERLLALIPVLSREDSGNAYELMRQLAKPYSDSAFAHYAVAVLALQAGDTETAAERSLKAVEIDSEWVKPHLLYARSLLLSGKSDEAIDYTARLIGDDPDPDPEARLELAIMLVSAGRDDDALSQVNQILLEQPYRTDALRMMAIINFRLDHMDAAKADFEDLLQSGNYRMDALYYLGRIADMESDHTTAVRYYSQVVSGSNAVLSQSRVAGLLAQLGKDDKALEHLTRFAEVNPSYAVDMLRAKAQLLVSMGRHDESLALFDQVVEYRPDNEGVQLGRAELLLRMDRLDDAISQYRLTLKRWPESAMSMNALGYTLADRTEEYEEAAKLIRKALDLTPDSAAIMDSWGWVLYRQGKAEEGLGFLMDAYQIFRDPEIAGHIVEVLWSLERHDEAIEALDDAELLFPDSEFLKEMRERYGPETP